MTRLDNQLSYTPTSAVSPPGTPPTPSTVTIRRQNKLEQRQVHNHAAPNSASHSRYLFKSAKPTLPFTFRIASTMSS
jgi:hypothetical protein